MELFKHQKDIIDQDPKYTGLFLGTGSSKTRIALELAKGKILVICPKTQKEDANWERENKKWNINKDVTVISKETFRRDHQSLPRFNTVIVDEAHTCLGVTPNTRWHKRVEIPKASQLFEALEEYVIRTRPDRFYLATATIMRSPMVVWAATKLLGYNFNFYEFRGAFYFPLPMAGRPVWAVKTDSESKDRLARLVRKIGHVGRLEDFFDVPEQTHKVEYVELTTAQKKRLKELPLEYADPLVLLGKKLQVENGVLAGDEFNDHEIFDNAKLDRVLEYSYEFPRMIVFAKYTHQITILNAALTQMGKKVFVLDGHTKDKGALLDEAKKCNEYVFLAQAQVSAGWELPECPVMIFASKTYSFVDYSQGIGRIQRANNIKKNLYIHLVVKGGIDESVHKCIEEKKDFDERVFLNV